MNENTIDKKTPGESEFQSEYYPVIDKKSPKHTYKHKDHINSEVVATFITSHLLQILSMLLTIWAEEQKLHALNLFCLYHDETIVRIYRY